MNVCPKLQLYYSGLVSSFKVLSFLRFLLLISCDEGSRTPRKSIPVSLYLQGIRFLHQKLKFWLTSSSLSLMLQTGAFLHLILTFTSITARLDSIVIEVISIMESLKEVLHNLLEAMVNWSPHSVALGLMFVRERAPEKDLERREKALKFCRLYNPSRS